MHEDSISTFLKSRDGLIKSILDWCDVDDSVEEYIFAKSNLIAHNYSYDKTWKENICDSFILTKQKRLPSTPFLHGSDYIERKRDISENMARINQSHLSKRHPWRGRTKGKGHLIMMI